METAHTDVLILGAGAAGIRAALAAHEAGARVLLVAKSNPTEGGSTFSNVNKGWGIQGLVGKERTEKDLEVFYDDIMDAGLGVQDPELVRILVEESGPRIQDLISYGIDFKKDRNGNYQRAKGCFSDHPRAFITADFSNMRNAFLSILRRTPVRFVTGLATELIMVDGCCWGANVITSDDKLVNIVARASILACGGGAGIYEHHLASNDLTGGGYALASSAGADLTNMEFIQFMLGLRKNGNRRFLPLAQLDRPESGLNTDGKDLLKQLTTNDSKRKKIVEDRNKHFPFSSRDDSLAIDLAVARQNRNGKKVFWTHNKSSNNRTQVVHFAHAFNGGVKINATAESSVPGLYAAGEVAAGAHGADRIGGCMMTATQVFGKRAGQSAAQWAKSRRSLPFPDVKNQLDTHLRHIQDREQMVEALGAVEQRIKAAVDQHAGILRNRRGLKKGLDLLGDCEKHLFALRLVGGQAVRKFHQVQSALTTAKLVTESALKNENTIGPHFREDFPEPQNN